MQTDIRDFLALLEEEDLLIRVKEEVPLLAIPQKMKEAEKAKKALIIEKPGDSENEFFYNVVGSQKMLALAFECDEKDVVREFIKRTDNPIAPNMIESSEAAVHEIVIGEEDVNIGKLPLIIHSLKDAGRYITAGTAVAKDPETKIRNVSFNRMQLKEKNRMGIRMMPPQHLGVIQEKAEKNNEILEVAVVLGNHPFELLAASTSPEYGLDEYHLAGGLRGEALDMVKCKTIDMEVPANAEIVLECEIRPKEREEEGPFGDFLGYYVPVMENHIIHVKTITMRKNAKFQTMKAGSIEDTHLLGISREAKLLKAIEVEGIQVEAVSLNPMLFNGAISIKKRFEDEAKNVMMSAFGAYSWLKFCIVVDHDVDVFDTDDIWWAMGTRCGPDKGIIKIPHAKGFPRDPYNIHQSKVGIDCTVPMDSWDEFERITIPTPEDYD